MKIKYLITLSVLFLKIYFLKAQFSDFDLRSYKLPDIRTTSLDLGFDLSHSISNTFLGVDETYQQDNHYTNAGGSFSIDYYLFRNTKNYQGRQQVNTRFDPDYSKSSTTTNTTRQSALPMGFSYAGYNRFYSSKGYFLGIDPNLSMNLVRMSASNKTRSEENRQQNLLFSVPVSFGKGRIEPVEDARLAVYILDELFKNSRIGQRPSDAVILAMASEISAIKRKRFFDSRIRKIEELQVIDSFLAANNIVSKSDIVYFTRLNDMWNYASGPARNTGFSASFGIDNSANLTRSQSEIIFNSTDTSKADNRMNIYTLGPFVNIMYSRPLNLYWQSDLSFTQSYHYQIKRDPLNENSIYSNEELNLLTTTLRYELMFIPNSRTSAALSAGCQYTYSFGGNYGYDPSTGTNVPGNLKGNNLNPSGGLAVQYYISPQVRLYFSWSIYHSSTRDRTEYDTGLADNTYMYDSFNNNIYLTFTYSIF